MLFLLYIDAKNLINHTRSIEWNTYEKVKNCVQNPKNCALFPFQKLLYNLGVEKRNYRFSFIIFQKNCNKKTACFEGGRLFF